MKRLAVFLDGTWDVPGHNTHVWRTKLMLRDQDNLGVQQLAYYDVGVGTTWGQRFSGGALGIGLSKNVLKAYQWLMEKYEQGDEVFVFGFSRGAFTARSLVGLIGTCGLLYPASPIGISQLYDRYRDPVQSKRKLSVLIDERNGDKQTPRDQWDENDLLVRYSRVIPIKLIAVWDTVGALGVPLWVFQPFNRRYQFHNTNLSSIVDHALHALAIDEHRRPFAPTLWTRPADATNQLVARQHCEQRWFAGAHANVGGGYRNDRLAQLPLHWVQSYAMNLGLAFRQCVVLDGDEFRGEPTDSLARFLGGMGRMGRPYYREIGRRAESGRRSADPTVNETLDASVIRRWQDTKLAYRPPSLVRYAEQNNVEFDRLDPSQCFALQGQASE